MSVESAKNLEDGKDWTCPNCVENNN